MWHFRLRADITLKALKGETMREIGYYVKLGYYAFLQGV